MIKNILLPAMFIFGLSFCFGQENFQSNEKSFDESIDSLNTVINQKVTSLDLLKKDRDRVDTLFSLMEDYSHLIQLWENKHNDIVYLTKKEDPLLVLLSESDYVFSSDLPDVSIVPSSLIPHYNSLAEIILVQKDIQAIEKKIEDKTKACRELNQDPLTVIPQLISEDLESIYLALSKIKESGLTTLSEEQKSYFDKNIKNKYNSFVKYFTNE